MTPTPIIFDGVLAGADIDDFYGRSTSASSTSSISDGRGKLKRGPAPSFYCPLTMVIMNDPVQDREGNSYEKDAIMKWLSKNNTSPVTRNVLRMKHLVPNRALKEAIEFEVKRQKEMHTRKTQINSLPSKRTSSRTSTTTSGRHSTRNHHQIINNILSNLNVKSRLDTFGIAYLPMNKLRLSINNEPINMLMVIDAHAEKKTFQLYTHFDASLEQQRISAELDEQPDAGTTNENRVFNNLLQHGKHKALTLTNVCEERMRFGFEGNNSEISSNSNFVGILNMFVKVSFRMKKRIEA